MRFTLPFIFMLFIIVLIISCGEVIDPTELLDPDDSKPTVIKLDAPKNLNVDKETISIIDTTVKDSVIDIFVDLKINENDTIYCTTFVDKFIDSTDIFGCATVSCDTVKGATRYVFFFLDSNNIWSQWQGFSVHPYVYYDKSNDTLVDSLTFPVWYKIIDTLENGKIHIIDTSFLIYGQDTPGDNWVICDTLTNAHAEYIVNGKVSFMAKGLQPGELYNVIARAENDNFFGAWAVDTAVIDLRLPSAPKDIVVKYIAGRMELTFEPRINDPLTSGYEVIVMNTTDGDSLVYGTYQLSGSSDGVFSLSLPSEQVYKVAVRTKGIYSSLSYDSVFNYDPLHRDSTALRLPYIYLSTYSTPFHPSGAEFIGVPGGTFLIGDIWNNTDTVAEGVAVVGKPVREVRLTSFSMMRSEVSVEQYCSFLNSLDTAIIKEVEISSYFPVTFKDTFQIVLLVDTLDSMQQLHSWDILCDTLLVGGTGNIVDTAGLLLSMQLSYDSTDSIIDADKDSSIYITYEIIKIATDSISTTDRVTTVDPSNNFYVQADTIIVNGTDSLWIYKTFLIKHIHEKFTDQTADVTGSFSFFVNTGTDSIMILDETALFIKDTTGIYHINPDSVDSMPICGVSWDGAALYCNYLSDSLNMQRCYSYDAGIIVFDSSSSGYRLPTEAEFEYVQSMTPFGAYPNRKQRYPWGYSDINESRSVGITPVNCGKSVYGFYHLSGNLWEWCSDYFDGANGSFYSAFNEDGATINPINFSSDYSIHVLRGGALESSNEEKRSYYNHQDASMINSRTYGFRVVRGY